MKRSVSQFGRNAVKQSFVVGLNERNEVEFVVGVEELDRIFELGAGTAIGVIHEQVFSQTSSSGNLVPSFYAFRCLSREFGLRVLLKLVRALTRMRFQL